MTKGSTLNCQEKVVEGIKDGPLSLPAANVQGSAYDKIEVSYLNIVTLFK